MTRTYPKDSQFSHEAALTAIGTVGETPLNVVIDDIEQNTRHPLRIYANNTPDSKLYFSSSVVKTSVGTDRVTELSIDSTVNFGTSGTESWIDFQGQSKSGAEINTITWPSSTVGYYRKCVFWLMRDGTINAVFTGQSNVSLASLEPLSTYVIGGLIIGWVDLICTHISGQFQTPFADTPLTIQNLKSGVSYVHEVIADRARLINRGAVDPSVTAQLGYIGEILEETDVPQLWQKQDAGSTTNWKPLDWSIFRSGYSGWASTSGITLTFSTTSATNDTVNISGTRTFYVLGRPFKKTVTESLVMSGSAGTRFFSYDSAGNFQQSTLSFDFVNQACVATAYWTGSLGHSLGWELHGLTDAADHSWKHLTIGTRYITGFGQVSNPLSGGNPTGDTESLIWLAPGSLFDEDIRITVSATLTPTSKWDQNLGSLIAPLPTALSSSNAAILPFLYVNASGVTTYVAPDANRFPFMHGGGNTLPYYINAGVPTATPSGNFAVYWIFGTDTQVVSDVNFTNVGTAVVAMPQDATYTTIIDARTANPPIGINLQEAKSLYRIIYECKSAFNNATHRCVIREIADYRSVSSVPVGASSSNDHLLLNNLNAGQYGDGNHINLAQIVNSATSPTVANDSVGYKQLALWLNTVADEIFINADNSAGAAIWKELIVNGGNTTPSFMTLGTLSSYELRLMTQGVVHARMAASATIPQFLIGQGSNYYSTLTVEGGISSNVTILNSGTTTLTLDVSHSHIQIDSANLADVTITLGVPSTFLGTEITIKKCNSDAYKVSVVPTSGTTIEGIHTPTYPMIFNAVNETYRLKSDGASTWRII